MKNIILLVSISLLFISCSDNSVSPNETRNGFKGIVKDINGNLLSNVDVFLIFEFETIPNKQFIPYTPESVILTSFTAVVNENKVVLNWSTSLEQNNRGFEIQKKHISANVFTTIGFVDGVGTTNEPKNYAYEDFVLLSGRNIYRLKQTDFDGSFEYSSELEVEILPPSTFTFAQNYPNPFSSSTKLRYTLPKDSYVQIFLHSFFEKDTIAILQNQLIIAGSHELALNLGSLPNNLYEIELNAEFENQIDKKEIVVMKNYSDTSNINLIDRSFTQTSNGEFQINYSKIALEKTFNSTDTNSPEVLTKLKIKSSLSIVLYKEGFKKLVRTAELNSNAFMQEDFILEFE